MNLALIWARFVLIAQYLFLFSSSLKKLRTHIKLREFNTNPVQDSFENSEYPTRPNPYLTGWCLAGVGPHCLVWWDTPPPIQLSPGSIWVCGLCCRDAAVSVGPETFLEHLIWQRGDHQGCISLRVRLPLVLSVEQEE